jgi:hypothetical protein
MNFEKEFSHESMPDFKSVMDAVTEPAIKQGQSPEPLSTRVGSIIHPKLKDVTFKFWALPEIAPLEKPEVQANPKDFVAVTFEGDVADEKKQYFTGLVFRSFSEAQAELTKLATVLFENEGDKNETTYNQAV